MRYSTHVPDQAGLKRREKQALLAAAFIVALSACSGGGGNGIDSAGADAPAGPQVAEVFSVASALQSFDAVSVDALTPFVQEELEESGLYNVQYLTETQCAEAWEVSHFTFDNAGRVSAQFCDGTRFNSDYALESGVVVLSNIALDGELVGEGMYEFWGQLADASIAAGSRACLATLDTDAAASEREEAAQASSPVMAPSIDQLTFDCNVEEYFFRGREDANNFSSIAGIR